MANLTEKLIENLKQLKESNQEFDEIAKVGALAAVISKEKGLDKSTALPVAVYIVRDGMSYEEALAEVENED